MVTDYVAGKMIEVQEVIQYSQVLTQEEKWRLNNILRGRYYDVYQHPYAYWTNGSGRYIQILQHLRERAEIGYA